MNLITAFRALSRALLSATNCSISVMTYLITRIIIEIASSTAIIPEGV